MYVVRAIFVFRFFFVGTSCASRMDCVLCFIIYRIRNTHQPSLPNFRQTEKKLKQEHFTFCCWNVLFVVVAGGSSCPAWRVSPICPFETSTWGNFSIFHAQCECSKLAKRWKATSLGWPLRCRPSPSKNYFSKLSFHIIITYYVRRYQFPEQPELRTKCFFFVVSAFLINWYSEHQASVKFILSAIFHSIVFAFRKVNLPVRVFILSFASSISLSLYRSLSLIQFPVTSQGMTLRPI